jgi:phytoene dehydrogenase-like protein
MALHRANIVGSGPNGLAAAITLAQHGVAVTVFERNERLGGACSTAELTLPGFRHDVGSSCFPLGVVSPFFRSLPLEEYGLRWIEPPAPLAHPLDDGSAVTLEHEMEATAAQFEAHDARAWRALMGPSVRDWQQLVDAMLKPWMGLPRRLDTMVGFGAVAMFPAKMLARAAFRSEAARALFAGCAAHSVLPLTRVPSSAVGLAMISAGHTTGWPIAAGGAQSISDALAAYLRSLGGRIIVDFEVNSLEELERVAEADVTLFDTSTAALEHIARNGLTASFRRRLRGFQAGPGIFKVDFALREPIPWKAAACVRAATVHVGGTLAEIARSERDAFYGFRNERPFVLVVQPSLFDPERAPATDAGQAQHTAWAYCHVPVGSADDMTDVIESQIERFAPGFRECILARRASGPAGLAAWNPNLMGGDVAGGAMTLTQLVLRPTARLYRTSNERLYLCSSSTPPGGGVHGMCGHLAALAALTDHARR